MIITVTMNPAIDKTVEIEGLKRGGLNRIRKMELDAGGKGINVSRTIRELGGNSVATGFLGGSAGLLMEKLLTEQGIRTDFVHVAGETRTNTKVLEQGGPVTELNEPGPEITEEEQRILLEKLASYGKKGTLFVLAGSVPKGIPETIYGEMIRLAHEKGAEVLLDADGALLREGIRAVPDLVKPNREELLSWEGLEENASEEELLAAAQKLISSGIREAAISMGDQGALFLKETYAVRCPALNVTVQSTVGAGDAMAAAMAFAWEQRWTGQRAIRLCMAVSAGAVTTFGTRPPQKELTEQLKQQVTMKYL
jgi:1-phosphofructokinase